MATSKKRQNPLINMDPNDSDIHYRYKFEKLIIKSEGRNTGQKTVLINIIQIADGILGTKMDNNNTHYTNKEIKQTAQHITKYIGKKLGVNCQFKKQRNVSIISGVHSQYELQKIIFDYVFDYAMCPKCNKPELTAVIYAQISCKSCNYTKGKYKKDKRNKQKSNKKRKKNIKKQNEEMKGNELDNDIDNNKQKKEECMRKDAIFALDCFIKENNNIKCDEIMEKIKILSIAHTLDRKQQIKMIIYVLMEYINGDYKLLIESIKKYSDIFEIFTMLENDTEIFLAYLEEIIICKSNGNGLLNYTYKIFNCLYDEDIIGEDEINQWYVSKWEKRFSIINKEEGKLIREKVKPFVIWLQNAENDDDDDDDEDED
eukprot:143158_1